MCGRYTLTSQEQLVTDMELEIADDVACAGVLAVAPGFPAGLASWWAPRWNIAPTQPAPVVVMREVVATLCLMRWGLVPHWATDLKVGARMINARAETVGGARPFREPLRRRRCLVAADGFYEWARDGKRRIPYRFAPAGGGAFTFAGIWDRWKPRGGDPDARWVESYSILTVAADPLVAPLHDRMPLVVAPDDRARWLSREELPPDALADLLRPTPLDGWERTAAEPWVNAASRERAAATG
jgi:putative SOS response-associated peptidase YedK